jgi:alkyl sulfatase BDS1-like metallo-beta-lactamase superfamily hydrolase
LVTGRDRLANRDPPQRQPPPDHSIKILQATKGTLPVDDTRDAEEQARGLNAQMPARQIMAEGRVAIIAPSDFMQFTISENLTATLHDNRTLRGATSMRT